MRELVLFVAKHLAEHPEKIEVKQSEQEGAVSLRLNVAEEDKGRIIGKQGKVIKAIRTLVQVASAKSGKKIIVSVD